MESQKVIQYKNPLEEESPGKLILKYSFPAIVSSLINSIYNIVDQIFIGNSVGRLGNAATNIEFPLVLIVSAVSMTLGVGGASAFSLHLGRREEKEAEEIVGNGLMLMLIFGVGLCCLSLLFLRSLLIAFGGRGQTLEYAVEYTRISAVGIPLSVLVTGASQFIRADGSPRYSMAATLSGAILNCILDPVFIFVFHMGMSGAALATVIGKLVSAVFVISYLRRFQTFKLQLKDFLLKKKNMIKIFRLGAASGANQLAVTLMQIVMNNILGYYGEQSVYGRDIPLACVGVISKVNNICSSVNFGIAQSTQPIIGYNYGAGNYARVKTAFKKAAWIVTEVSLAAFLCFQFFPLQITRIFGSGDELYFDFALRYFRIFLSCVFITGFHALATNFFPSIGKGGIGTIVSLSRQVFFLLPLLIVFPMLWGIDGVLWTGPIADGLSGVLALWMVRREMRRW